MVFFWLVKGLWRPNYSKVIKSKLSFCLPIYTNLGRFRHALRHCCWNHTLTRRKPTTRFSVSNTAFFNALWSTLTVSVFALPVPVLKGDFVQQFGTQIHININASTTRINTSKKHINKPKTNVNTSTHQQINTLTHQQTHQHINTIINTSTRQHINTSTHQHINTIINPLTHQPINTSTHQHINTSTHQQINTIINTSFQGVYVLCESVCVCVCAVFVSFCVCVSVCVSMWVRLCVRAYAHTPWRTHTLADTHPHAHRHSDMRLCGFMLQITYTHPPSRGTAWSKMVLSTGSTRRAEQEAINTSTH
jgi:hypothetical protein